MRDVTLYVVAGVWLFGTVVVALVALGCVIYFAIRRKAAYAGIAILLAAVAALANPMINMLVFSRYAEACRERMLEAARADSCVGRSTEWLSGRFGKPSRVHHSGDTDHWWYTPGPWFIVHEDYVGFEIVQGRVTNAYMQIN